MSSQLGLKCCCCFFVFFYLLFFDFSRLFGKIQLSSCLLDYAKKLHCYADISKLYFLLYQIANMTINVQMICILVRYHSISFQFIQFRAKMLVT